MLNLLFVCEKVALSNMSPHYVLDVLITIGLHILCMLYAAGDFTHLKISYKNFSHGLRITAVLTPTWFPQWD